MSTRFDKFRKVLNTVDRRSVLGKGAAVVGGLMAAQFIKPRAAEAQTRPAARPADKTFTVTVGGEIMATRPFAMQTEPEFLDLDRKSVV